MNAASADADNSLEEQSRYPATNQDIRWDVTCADPADPFTYTLIFSNGDTELARWPLTPTSTSALQAALSHVRDAQLDAITAIDPDRAPAPAPAVPTTPDQQPPLPELTWWARHKAFSVIAACATIALLCAFISGGTSI